MAAFYTDLPISVLLMCASQYAYSRLYIVWRCYRYF